MTTLRTAADKTEAVSPPSQGRQLVVSWAAGTGIAVVLVSLIFQVALGLSEALRVAGPDGTIVDVTIGNTISMTVLGGSVGAALAYAIGRWTPRPRITFLAICVAALAGYAVVPFQAAETVSAAIWLNTFHVAVALPVVGFLARTLPSTRS